MPTFDFDAETFLALSVKQRVDLCKRWAERAQELASAAGRPHSESYLDIAASWLQLADEMERVDAMEKSKIRLASVRTGE